MTIGVSNRAVRNVETYVNENKSTQSNVVRLNEADLRYVVAESVKRVIKKIPQNKLMVYKKRSLITKEAYGLIVCQTKKLNHRINF